MRSTTKDPVKSPLSTPVQIDASASRPSVGIADIEATSGEQTLVAKILPVSPSRGREDHASTAAPIDNSDDPPKSNDESQLVPERVLEPDSAVVTNKLEHEIEGYTSSLSPKNKELDGSPYLPRKREWEEGSDDEAAVEIKANKKMRLSLSRAASPFDLSGGLQFNFDTAFGNPYSFDDVYQYWETDVPKSKDLVDDLLGRECFQGNDNQSTFISIPPTSFDWDECKTLNEVVTAPLSADDLYMCACEKLRAYKAQINAGSDFKARKIARDEMAEAWRSWNLKATVFIGMGELRSYGEVLDAEGRESLANALDVQSDSLQGWIDGAPLSRKEPQTPAHPPIPTPVRHVTPASRSHTDAPVAPPNPIPFSVPASAPLHPIPASVPNPNPTMVQTQVPVRAPVHTQRRRHVPVPAQTDVTTQGPAPTPVPAPAILTSHASTSTPATVPTQTSAPVVGQPASVSPPTPTLVSIPAPVPVVPVFAKTTQDKVAGKKENANATGKLPSWAKDVLYTDSSADLVLWTNARKAALKQNPIGMSQAEEQRILGDLYGSARADLTPQERRFSAEKRACDALPDHQKPILLDNRSNTQNAASDREYMLICRASFALEDRTFNYRTSICGEAFSTHDIVLRHLKEQHLDKGRKERKRGSNVAATPTVASAAVSAIASTSVSVSVSAATPSTSQAMPSNSTLSVTPTPPSIASTSTAVTTSTGPITLNPPPTNEETSQ
ncbi:hypothetical protein FRC17_004400 [Serendipita sp. 399]|nr:hypothetical protein FRC17_004400 [Serendipita sp. 399]